MATDGVPILWFRLKYGYISRFPLVGNTSLGHLPHVAGPQKLPALQAHMFNIALVPYISNVLQDEISDS